MDATVADTTKAYDKGFSHGQKIASTTEVVGAVVAVVGIFCVVNKVHKAMVKRAVRREMKKEK